MKRRLIRAKIKLNQTIQQILEINRKRRKLPYLQNAAERRSAMDKELKVLNKIAEHQAKLVRHYESKISQSANR